MANEPVQVEKATLQEEMRHKNKVMLSLKIEYPQFQSNQFPAAAARMSEFDKKEALAYQRHCRHDLLKMAIEEYEYAVAYGFPVRPFEALMTYEITYNQDCTVSLYMDRYEYTGGAHGLTVRRSNTWSLPYGRRITLRQMFPELPDYKESLITYINSKIARQIAGGENYYFEDYEKNVRENFDTNSFYLTKDGVVIYFQQYEIAPYASGIPSFLIPYAEGGAFHPRCI